MSRLVLLAIVLLLFACNNNGKKSDSVKEDKTPTLGVTFPAASLPYQLADTSLTKITGPALSAAVISPLLADSIKTYFGKGDVKYSALGKLSQKEKETYYIVGVAAGTKKGAVVLVFTAADSFAASYPLLLPDADPATTQLSTIDKNFTVTKTVSLRRSDETTGEGKEVVAYDAATKSFSLIMQDALNDNPAELVNPIDTFGKKHPLAGDYFRNKKNLISVRDGRTATELLVFIHTENEAADCIGQLKGEFILTSSTTAAYRQSGDPCVLGVTFKGATVTMNEERGCGNYRGLDCPLSGTFTRKKTQSAKPAVVKPKRK